MARSAALFAAFDFGPAPGVMIRNFNNLVTFVQNKKDSKIFDKSDTVRISDSFSKLVLVLGK